MKGKKLKVAFVDNEKEIFKISDVKPEILAEGIKELTDELVKGLKK